MTDALLELYRHKTWATLRLIEICQGLSDEHLDAYFRILTHERLAEPLPAGPAPLDELAKRIRRLGPRWEVVAQDSELPGREVTSTDGWRFPGAVAMAQAIHHADDHRTHILSILGARGMELPDLAIWGYAEAMGQMHELEPKSD